MLAFVVGPRFRREDETVTTGILAGAASRRSKYLLLRSVFCESQQASLLQAQVAEASARDAVQMALSFVNLK